MSALSTFLNKKNAQKYCFIFFIILLFSWLLFLRSQAGVFQNYIVCSEIQQNSISVLDLKELDIKMFKK